MEEIAAGIVSSLLTEQMVRYTGYYSNVCRGRRKKQQMGESDKTGGVIIVSHKIYYRKIFLLILFSQN